MKFTKEKPTKDGYYWYVDLEYPIPKIGFWSCSYESLFDTNNFKIRFNDKSFEKYIRIGDLIPEPNCQDNEIDY